MTNKTVTPRVVNRYTASENLLLQKAIAWRRYQENPTIENLQEWCKLVRQCKAIGK